MEEARQFVKSDNAATVLTGDWTIADAGRINLERAAHNFKDDSSIRSEIGKLDVAGALLLQKIQEKSGRKIEDLSEEHRKLLDFFEEQREDPPQTPTARHSFFYQSFYDFGHAVSEGAIFTKNIISFIGLISVRLFSNILHPRHFRLASIVRHIQETGIGALPIMFLLALMISLVVFYQGATQLQKFGADIFTVDLTAISILREMGVLLTAIMIAGRSSSAFTAEIGVMKLREEVDALKTMGMDPIEILVLPRIIALVIVLPILTFMADVIGLFGGSVMSKLLLDIPFVTYWDRVQQVTNFNMFFVGMIKAPVFAFLIAVIGCYQGMNVSSSAESIGRLTTLSVVQSIFLVIMADAFFSIVFSIVDL